MSPDIRTLYLDFLKDRVRLGLDRYYGRKCLLYDMNNMVVSGFRFVEFVDASWFYTKYGVFNE